MRDVSVPPLGDKRLDCGVNPRLVFAMREAIDREWRVVGPRGRGARARRGVLPGREDRGDRRLHARPRSGSSRTWACRPTSTASAPGCSPRCDEHGTNNDFTADVVRVRIDGTLVRPGEDGPQACDNLMLERVQ